jgi:predicted  nucleic acid-binding Zn-ribbon protein
LKDLEKEISNLEFEAQGFERELEHAKKKIDKVREKHAEIEQNLRVKASSLGWMIE